MRNELTKLYNAVSAPLAATRDALTKRLQSVRETASLLYNRMMEKMDGRNWKISWKKKQKKKSKGNIKKKNKTSI